MSLPVEAHASALCDKCVLWRCVCVRALWIQRPTDEGAPVQQLRRCDVTPRPDQACAQAQVDAR